MINKYMRISDDAHNNLSYYKSILGKKNVNEVISLLKITATIDDVKKGLEYVKNHKKTEGVKGRVVNILSWLNKELNSEVELNPEYKEDLLKLKIFCEEYLK